jgi:hypothetical protein
MGAPASTCCRGQARCLSCNRDDYEELIAGEDADYGVVHVLSECDFAMGGTGQIMRIVDFMAKGNQPLPIYNAPIC